VAGRTPRCMTRPSPRPRRAPRTNHPDACASYSRSTTSYTHGHHKTVLVRMQKQNVNMHPYPIYSARLKLTVLTQEGHPVAYLSKTVCEKNQGLSTYEKECTTVIPAVDKWRSYLQHHEFVIKTDHRSLLFLTEQRAHTKLQHKALLKLMDLQFKIQYKQGTANVAADALSRCTLVHMVSALSACTPSWITNLIEGYQDDS